MENGFTDINLIERYLDGSLDDTVAGLVKKRLSEDPEFQALYKKEKTLERGIRYSFLKSKLEEIKQLENGISASSVPDAQDAKGNKRGRMLTLPYWKPLAAAAGLILVAVSYFLFQPETGPANERLFAANYEPFDSPGSGLTRSEDDTLMTWKQKGYQAYDHARYEEAISYFQMALKQNDDPVVELCQGNAYLSLGQAEKAEVVFRSILNDHEDLVTQAKWYLALAYLKQNKLERAKSTLWEISKSSTYGEKARRLLEELD